MKKWSSGEELLNHLNDTYLKIHSEFERYFWISYMGDRSVNKKKDKAEEDRESFRTNPEFLNAIDTLMPKSRSVIKVRLGYWKEFFSRYVTPSTVIKLRREIAKLETKISKLQSTKKEGYIDPHTQKFVALSRNGIHSLKSTSDDESIRKACFDSLESLAVKQLKEYVLLVAKRNQYARALGYEDFYGYKLAIEEKMTKEDLFSLWDKIFDKTKYAFANIRALEKNKPGLRKPWNFSYMIAGSFIKEADQYFPFQQALLQWGESFERMGINFNNGTVVLDLLDRKGKYNNGFCHWPIPVSYKNGFRRAGTAQFTCTLVPGIPGQSYEGINTLFHEGGHAAHLLNCDNKDVCLNIEYPPASTAWDETQSMFLDSICSSIEWKHRYAKNNNGEPYPLDLFLRQAKATYAIRPLSMMGILMVCNFEKEIYETKNLTEEMVVRIAKKVYRKHTDRSIDSVRLLDIPHIYSWESSCSYHGYGLATLALSQWRSYFFKKYGYIVDNPNVGKEMLKLWKLGSKISFLEMVKRATGKKLSADVYIKNVTMTLAKIQKTAKQRIERQLLVKQKKFNGINLKTSVEMVHGKTKIADNKKGYEKMVQEYSKWLNIKNTVKIKQ